MKKIIQYLLLTLIVTSGAVGCNESTSPTTNPPSNQNQGNNAVTPQTSSGGGNSAPTHTDAELSEVAARMLTFAPELMGDFQGEPACEQFKTRLQQLKAFIFEPFSGTAKQAISGDQCFGGTFYASFVDVLSFNEYRDEKADAPAIQGDYKIDFAADVSFIRFYITSQNLSFGGIPIEIDNLRISLPQTSGTKPICDEDVIKIEGRECTISADCQSCKF